MKVASLVQIEEEKTLDDDVLSVAPEPGKEGESVRSNVQPDVVHVKASGELEES